MADSEISLATVLSRVLKLDPELLGRLTLLRLQDGGQPQPPPPQPQPKDDPPPVPVTPEEARLILIQALGGRVLLRNQGAPCCEVLLLPEVRNIRIERRLENGDFESPMNGIFETEDTVKISFDVTACRPLDIRVDLTSKADPSSNDRVLTLDDVDRGPTCAQDAARPDDPDASSCRLDAVDLAKSGIRADGAEAKVLTVSVRDNCGRVAIRRIELTFVDV